MLRLRVNREGSFYAFQTLSYAGKKSVTIAYVVEIKTCFKSRTISRISFDVPARGTSTLCTPLCCSALGRASCKTRNGESVTESSSKLGSRQPVQTEVAAP